MSETSYAPEKTRKPPRYTEAGTIEWLILAGGEKFFADRDEKLRYGLVKRALQWMLDSEENGWFDQYRRLHELSYSFHSREPQIRSSRAELDEYLFIVSNDVADETLTGELSALNDYLSALSDTVPAEYEHRYNFVANRAQRYDERSRYILEVKGSENNWWRRCRLPSRMGVEIPENLL